MWGKEPLGDTLVRGPGRYPLSLCPLCPALFCDYYNPTGECEWHYQPCGAPCLRTCRNPSGRCLVDLPGLEGEGAPREMSLL